MSRPQREPDEYTLRMDHWGNLKAIARALPDEDLERNASASIYAHHACSECFNCACWAVKDERRNQRINEIKGQS